MFCGKLTALTAAALHAARTVMFCGAKLLEHVPWPMLATRLCAPADPGTPVNVARLPLTEVASIAAPPLTLNVARSKLKALPSAFFTVNETSNGESTVWSAVGVSNVMVVSVQLTGGFGPGQSQPLTAITVVATTHAQRIMLPRNMYAPSPSCPALLV
jgi:hypothetical protein